MLTDFGCASDNPTILYDWPGTVPYLAPEQVEGKTHGRAVDYWSCGIVGLELILRRAITSRIMPERNLKDYQDSLKISDSPLAKCSLAMLQVDPKRRMSAADALSHFKSAWTIGASNKRRVGSIWYLMAYYWRQETCRLDVRELRFPGIFLIQAAACACVVCQLCGKEAPLCERNGFFVCA